MMIRICKTRLSIFMALFVGLSATLAHADNADLAAPQNQSFTQEVGTEKFSAAVVKFAEWRDIIDTLEVVYTWEDHRVRRNFLIGRADSSSETMVFRSKLQWQDWWTASDAQMMRVVTENIRAEPGSVYTVSGRHDNLQYFAEYELGNAAPRLLTTANLGTKKTLQCTEQFPLYPVYFAITNWFSQSYEKFPIVCVGSRMIDGHECIGISVADDAHPTMWLDLEHDGFPRRIESTNNISSWIWQCDEFQQTSAGCWFPKKGSFGHIGSHIAKFDVESVRVNAQLPKSNFELPAVSKATYVRDMTTHGLKLKMLDTKDQRASIARADLFSWWRINCSLMMIAATAVWLRLRKRVEAPAVAAS